MLRKNSLKTTRAKWYDPGLCFSVNLHFGSWFTVQKNLDTYNPPTAKMDIKAIFCRRPRFRLRITGIGSMIKAKSVTILIPALVLYNRSAFPSGSSQGTNLQPHGKLIDTRSGLSGPESSYWNTCKYTREHSPKRINYDYSHESPTCDLKPFCGEHSLVLEKDGAFCQAQS
jgi:hypothetical protein